MTNSHAHHTLEESSIVPIDENQSPSNSDNGQPRKKARLFPSSRRLSQSTDALRFSFGTQNDRARRDSYADKRTLGPSPTGSVGFACKKGLKPVSPNQDSFFVARHDSIFAYGVFDGHGRHGHDVSHLVKSRLSDPAFLKRLCFANSRLSSENLAGVLRDEFAAIQAALVRDTRASVLDASASGTTATVVVRQGNSLTTAWVGDSRAILVNAQAAKEAGTSDDDGAVVELSFDHKPNLPAERKRIEAEGGVVVKPMNDVNYRVYVKNQKFPGLAMSRALGDLVGHFNAGVSCEPEISSVEIADQTHLVLCSDGVWEFIDSEECARLVRKLLADGMDEAAAAEALAKEAYDRWIVEEKGMVVDDVTVIIAKL